MAKALTVSEMGKRGGAARAKSLTSKQREDIARLGGLASGAKRKQNGKGKADVRKSV
jgi:general stress protein YciG